MSLSKENKYYIEFLKDIFDVSAACSTKTFVWGGTTIDILEGKFLREHHDIDGFTLDLLDVRDEMNRLFTEKGYETSYLHEVDILGIKKNDLHAGFNRLEIDADTAMWRHAGDEGTLYFPARWLDSAPRDFYDAKVYISGIEFEYAIKTNPQLSHPEWKPRDKDCAAIEYLTKQIAARDIKREDILKKVWSYTPYWAKKGYADYALPKVAWPIHP